MTALKPLSGAPAARRTRLLLVIGETIYGLRAIACDRAVAERGFRLAKADGTHYDVSQSPYGPHCDCPDFIFRRDGLDPDGCKHVRALVAQGLIDG
jgi:hypothetical protein